MWPREDYHRLACRLGVVKREPVLNVFDFNQIERLRPEIAVPHPEPAHLGPGQVAPPSYIAGIVQERIANGAQKNVEPFLVIRLADTLFGEVEIGEDLLARVQPIPR